MKNLDLVMNAINAVILDMEPMYTDADLAALNVCSVKELVEKQMKTSKTFFRNMVSMMAKKVNITEIELLQVWVAK